MKLLLSLILSAMMSFTCAGAAAPDLEVVRSHSISPVKAPETNFTGDVAVARLLPSDHASALSAGRVTFNPGARTAWHTHPKGQLLIIISGLGLVQQEGGPIIEVRPGDTVWFPPGINHWHGASANEGMAHYAIAPVDNGVSTTWREKVSEEAYRQKNQPKQAEQKKILIAYYSRSGNTEKLAKEIQSHTGGNLFRIETTHAYPDNYRETTEQAKKEIAEGFRPTLKTKVENIQSYDIVFLGSPNWWGTLPPTVSSFLESHDLSGKTLIPFISHGGGGQQRTLDDLKKQTPKSIVKKSFVTSGGDTRGLEQWLTEVIPEAN